jgi:hypothetical protein
MPTLFRIRGGDRAEYGPATADQILEWVRAGKADHLTPIRAEDSANWTRLEWIPDFAAVLPPPHPKGRRLPGNPPEAALPTIEELLARPIRFHVLDAFADGFKLLLRRPLVLPGSFLLSAGIVLALIALSFIPYAVIVTLPTALIVAGPLWGGLSFLALRAWRGEEVRIRELFNGFRLPLGALLRTSGRFAIATLLALLPGIGLITAGIDAGSQAQNLTFASAFQIIAGALLTLGLGLVPFALWGFTPTLMLERGLRPRDAFRLSRRITSLRPFRSLLFAAGCAILLGSGLLLGGIGLLVTVPWVLGARARAHDEFFGPRHAPSA